jgi:hypothetical protein
MSAAEKRPPLTVETAVLAAMKALPSYLGGATPVGVRVEEVLPPTAEASPFRITLSYLEPGAPEPRHPAQKALDGIWTRPPPMERVLRVVEVDAVTGQATGMRMHERA